MQCCWAIYNYFKAWLRCNWQGKGLSGKRFYCAIPTNHSGVMTVIRPQMLLCRGFLQSIIGYQDRELKSVLRSGGVAMGRAWSCQTIGFPTEYDAVRKGILPQKCSYVTKVVKSVDPYWYRQQNNVMDSHKVLQGIETINGCEIFIFIHAATATIIV